MALRNSPAIPEATRRRIQALAESMGYSPDPALRALIAYRNGRRPPEKIDTIAYITNGGAKFEWQNFPEYARYYAGASRKANQLGFHLEHFWLGEAGMSMERLARVFFHRRISGAIFAPYASDDTIPNFGWNRMCAVRIGRDPRTLGLHSVAADHAAALQLGVQQAIARGYRRIGIIIPPRWDCARREALAKSFLAEQQSLLPKQVVSLMRHDFEVTINKNGEADRPSLEQIDALRRWMLHERPDVVIGLSQSVAETLTRLGFSIPQDVGFLELSIAEDNSDFSGVRQNCEHVGAVAVEKLVGLMQQNQSGIPNIPTTTFVEPTWIEGSSLPVRS